MSKPPYESVAATFAKWLVLPLVIMLANAGSAQTIQLNIAQMSRNQVATTAPEPLSTTGTQNNEIVASPNDADLGEQQILRRTETYQPFVVSVAVPFYWTSNVALTNSGEQDDFLVSPVAAIAYQPRLTQNLFAYVSLREQLFYYNRFPDFNFGSFDAEVGLTYTIPQVYNLVLHAGYDYNRLTKKNSFDDFYQNHMFTLSAELPFHISRAQQFSIGTDAYVSMGATPEGPRRHDFDWWAGYSAQLTRAFVLGASGRIVLHDYVQGDRVDVTEMISVNATYYVTKYFTASALASFAANQSNHSVFDYEVGNLGGTVAFSLRF